jgi:MSHA biogenesis protein MshJ
MKKFNWQSLIKWLNARHVRERAILLCAGLGIVFMMWLTFVHDVLVTAKETEARNITIAQGRIADEQNRQDQIRSTYTTDPNSFALTRQRELRDAVEAADARRNELYGELISPQEMSRVLTSILQRDTTLRLISVGNIDSEALFGTAESEGGTTDLQVFKHGLRMVFEGSFLETVEYLRSLEDLEGNFFWESLEFTVDEYPTSRISLDIYTLSTEQGFIGV